jgi:hypothetical protein
MQPLEAIPAAYRADPLGYYAKLRGRTRPIIFKPIVFPEKPVICLPPIPIDPKTLYRTLYKDPIGAHLPRAISQLATFTERQRQIKVRIEEIAFAHKVSVPDVFGVRRRLNIVRAKHEVMWFLRITMDWTYPQVGKFLHMDHSSVHHGVKQHQRMIDGKPRLTWAERKKRDAQFLLTSEGEVVNSEFAERR